MNWTITYSGPVRFEPEKKDTTSEELKSKFEVIKYTLEMLIKLRMGINE